MISIKKYYFKLPTIFILLSIFLLVLFLPDTSKAMEPVYKVLSNTGDGEGKAVKLVWDSLIKLTNGFVVVVLIAVAFAQILRLNINTYGVKKILPTLVLAIIAANFSFLFCRLMVDFSNIVMSQFAPSSGDLSAFNEAFRIDPKYTATPTAGEVFWYILAQFLLIAGAILVYILAFLFLIRNWMIYFLVALAPLAFMAMVLPQTKSLFNQWWANFSKWVFMPVISIFWIWLGAQWYQSGFDSGVYLINFIFAGVCFYLAITTPFKMGGAVMNTWGKIGKTAWGKTGGAAWNATGGAGIKAGRDAISARYDRQKMKLKNRWYDTAPGQAMQQRGAKQRFLTQQEKDVYDKRQSDAERDVYVRAYTQEFLNRQPGGRGAKMNDAAYKRAIAKIRGKIGEERETHSNLIPSAIEKTLVTFKGINGAGEIKSEAEMSRDVLAGRMTPDEMVQVKAVINRARQLMNSTVNRTDTQDVMMNGYTDAAGVRHNPLIPAAYRDSWHTGDIAKDVYSSSAVGAPGGAQTQQSQIQSAQQNMANIAGAAVAGKLAEGAVHGSSFEETVELPENAALKVEIERFNPEAKHALKESYGHLSTGLQGGEESLEGLDKGLYRVKAMLFKPGANNNVDELIKTATEEINREQVPGGKESLQHALEALKTLERRKISTIPMGDFENFKNGVIESERSNQRMAVMHGSNLAQGTVNSLASVGANVPLENLSIDTALTHLNQSIEHLSETTHDIAHSAASPMGEMRGVGIGAIADREAFKGMLKESQAGLKDDIKGAMQGVFSHGYTGKDTLANPAVARIFAQEISTRLSQRLSKTPLTTQITNLPKAGETPHQTTTTTPAPTTTQPPAKTAPPPPEGPLKMPPDVK